MLCCMQRDHWDFKSEISPIPPEKFKSEFSASLNTKKPLSRQTQEKRKSLQAVNNNYFQRDQCECCNSGCFIRAGWHFFSIKRRTKDGTEGFPQWERCFFFSFCLLALQFVTGLWWASSVAPHINIKPQASAIWLNSVTLGNLWPFATLTLTLCFLLVLFPLRIMWMNWAIPTCGFRLWEDFIFPMTLQRWVWDAPYCPRKAQVFVYCSLIVLD